MAVEIGIIMGSQSDWPTLKEAALILDELGVAYETKIVSAHRTPDRLVGLRQNRRVARVEGDHRRRGRGRAFARHDGVENPAAGDWRAGVDQGAVGR